MSRTTKLELVQINARLASENHALRTQLSELSVAYKAAFTEGDPYTNGTYSVSAHQPTDAQLNAATSDERATEYADFNEARENCRRLVAWDADRRYMFVQRGNKVICKIRTAH